MHVTYIQNMLENMGLQGSSIITVILALLLSLIAYRFFFGIIRLWAKRTSHRVPGMLDRNFFYPGLSLFLVMGLITSLPVISIHMSAKVMETTRHILYLMLVFAIALVVIRSLQFTGDILKIYFDDRTANNLKARKVMTQFQLIQRILTLSIVVIAFGIGIMSFDKIRAIGTTILASAGILSIIIGFAAQKSLGTFIAGIQIAITQPIRHDDVVIVEGEWGRIEEITLTYIVVRIWDERRMVLPISYFLEKPFQNWTRTKSDLLATVTVFADYTLPIEPLREEFTRILNLNPLWDQQVNVLQVINATDKAIEIRALSSARNSSEAFDLRCDVREKLISFIQQNYPASLPHSRVVIHEKQGRN